MASHGVPRITSSDIKSVKEKEKEQRQIEQYRALESELRDAIGKRSTPRDTLQLTSKLLTWNPEHYTAWNHRRRCLQSLFAEGLNHEISSLVQADLDFLLPLLLRYPKCYWIWNHRWWVLRQCSDLLAVETAEVFWSNELLLDSKMLSRDSRNFHGWGYRRQVVEELERLQLQTRQDRLTLSSVSDTELPLCESEFKYTTTMISQNLSNFSAWHYRSCLIPQVLESRGASIADRRTFFDAELAWIKDALFTDPYDQSLWFYHQYLMVAILDHGRTKANWVQYSQEDQYSIVSREIAEIQELLDDTTDSKLVYDNLLQLTRLHRKIAKGSEVSNVHDTRDWLDRLQALDPLRKGRWVDLKRDLYPS